MKIKLLGFISIGILMCLFAYPQKSLAAAITEQNNGSSSVIVTLDPEGGTLSTTTMSVTYGSSYGTLPTPTRENYNFLGWYTFRNGGMKITEASKVIKNSNHKLYAKWQGKSTAITLDAQGGELEKNTVIVYYGSKFYYQLPRPTRKNYTFLGWYTTPGTTNTNPNGNITEDTGSANNNDNRSGSGNNQDKATGSKITKNSIFDEKSGKTLYARWEEKKIKLILFGFNEEHYELEVTSGKPCGALPSPTRTGYKFGGWYRYNDYSDPDAKAVTKDTVLSGIDQLKLFARWYPTQSER